MANEPTERSGIQGQPNRDARQGTMQPSRSAGGGQFGPESGIGISPGQTSPASKTNQQSGRERPWETDLGFKGVLENMRRLIRVQPVIWEACYNKNAHGGVPMQEGDIFDMLPDLATGGGVGPLPGGTVVTETAFGQASNAGALATYSREDHTHGTPASPVIPAAFPSGGIIMWSGLLVNIPVGWILCDGTAGTPDLRSSFVKGAAAGVDPGVTGGANTHTHTVTPTGSNSAPAFTGSAMGNHSHTETGTTSSDSAGTPAGSVAAPAFTGSALGTHRHTVTATGTNSGGAVDAHAGTAVAAHAAHTHDDSSQLASPDLFTSNVTATGVSARTGNPSATLTHSVTQPNNHTFTQPTFTGNSESTSNESAGTPAGTNSAPAFTGSALGNHSHTTSGTTSSDSAGTPSGSVAAPTFTGNLDTTSTRNNEPVYFSLVFIQKL